MKLSYLGLGSQRGPTSLRLDRHDLATDPRGQSCVRTVEGGSLPRFIAMGHDSHDPVAQLEEQRTSNP